MRLFDILRITDTEISPHNCKLHLASWNGIDDPLKVYAEGEFNEWQCWQTQRNFNRSLVISLIQTPETDRWIFAGVHKSAEPRAVRSEASGCLSYYYPLEEDMRFCALSGRLAVIFPRPGRQSYLNAERWVDSLIVNEIARQPLDIIPFPGYRQIKLSYKDLQRIISINLEAWRNPLSAVAGVYLITDNYAGQHYVGVACGQGGFWQRWSSYARTGHGDNTRLRGLLRDEAYRVNDFSYAILETADINTPDEDLYARESHWKNVLGSRAHGLNAN
ncbi:MAG: GIY-YIG nuclease family protein [Alphaproteobacteria bacterium]|nr:GIY-YIG nuclease family protein [Alphaproteobacteria bacterium]MCD8570811.1 GIY-YIG nuclease family protein [Alphaproteobacteria bacterium]